MYQYNMRVKRKNSALPLDNCAFAMQPPVSTASVYACETFKDFRKSMESHYIRHQGYLNDRLSHPIVGITGFSYKTDVGKSGIIAFQISSCGDLMFQSFFLENPEVAWRLEKIVSEPSFKLTDAQKAKFEKVDQIRFDWATKACAKYQDGTKKMNPINLRCTQTTLNCKQFSSQEFMNRLLQTHKAKRKGSCVLCTESFKEPIKSPSVDAIDDTTDAIPANCSVTVCQDCGSEKNYVKSMLGCHKASIFHPNKLEEDRSGTDAFWDSWSPPRQAPVVSPVQSAEIRPLKLVEPSFERLSLGRVLWSTWDAPYAELWDILDSESANKKVKKEAQNYEERFDLTNFPSAQDAHSERSNSISTNGSVRDNKNIEISTETSAHLNNFLSDSIKECNPKPSHETTTSPLLFEDDEYVKISNKLTSSNELAVKAQVTDVEQYEQAPLINIDSNAFQSRSVTESNVEEKANHAISFSDFDKNASVTKTDVVIDKQSTNHSNDNATNDSPDTLETLHQLNKIASGATEIREITTQVYEKLPKPNVEKSCCQLENSLQKIPPNSSAHISENSVEKMKKPMKKSLKRKMTGFF